MWKEKMDLLESQLVLFVQPDFQMCLYEEWNEEGWIGMWKCATHVNSCDVFARYD